MLADATASFPLSFALDLGQTLGPWQRGSADPTITFGPGQVSRAARTPLGPGSIRVRRTAAGVEAEAWGPGAGWLIANTPRWLGFDDAPESFAPPGGIVRELHRRHRGLRLGSTGLVFESLLPTILEQKVPGVEAWDAYRKLVWALGDPAPGELGLRLQPAPERLLATPYWQVHRFGIERRRFGVIQNAASVAGRLERTATMAPDRARPLLMSLPGVGPWTAAEVSLTAYGDRDAVSPGDYHLPHQVSWALAGEARGTDERMLRLLEPYRGHRARVIRLLTLGGIQAPRFGPRLRLRQLARI